jgi:hypothetical protein
MSTMTFDRIRKLISEDSDETVTQASPEDSTNTNSDELTTDMVEQLDEIADMADELYSALEDNKGEEIPDWVKENVNSAYASLFTVYSAYEDDEEDDDNEQTEESEEKKDNEGEVIAVSEEVVQLLGEEVSANKFRQLVRLGLADDTSISRVLIVMKKVDAGKILTPADAAILGDMFQTLIGIVTGDSAIYNRVKTAVSN